MHRFGYNYLPEGKIIVLQISSATNKYRYSNSKELSRTELPSEESIANILAMAPPFDVSASRDSTSRHLNLARKFTSSKGGNKGFTVYIYELKSKGYKDLKG